ncbi:MAG: N-acetylmuramoyl-L-alanine amidase, partial [Oscillospiraceae bacterium]
LTISLPAKTSFITYDESVQFRGKFDPNQEVLLNGEKVVPSERGGFSVWVPLNVGKNQIVLEHKGQKKYYNIERKVIIFKEWSPTENIKVAGSSQLELTALAYKNSKITATINGQTITLQEGGGGDQHLGDTSYVYYTGFFNVPKATAKEQNIGKIKFSGSYQGYGEQKDGANIIIDKLPDEVDPDELSGKVLRHITVNNPYANMYDYKTTPEFGSSVIYQLPQGSQDIVLSENTVHFKNSGKTHTYYNLRSGKTVRSDDVSVSNIPFVGNNRISKFTAGVEGNDTVIRLTMDWKAPISVNLNPYPKTVNEAGKKYVFSSSQVEILLDYSTTVAKDNTFIDLSNSRVFSGITHERVRNEALNIWQYKITLPLSSGSRYYGCHATYEGNDLVIKFNHGPTGGGSLSGVNIVVDPGHGGNDTGTMAGRDVLEKTVNLSLAEKIKYELEALGANVYMTRTGDVNPSVADRSNYAYQIQADLFISVHHNSAGSDSKPNGIETYYNTPFSQPLAQAVHSQITRYSLGDRGVRTGIDRNFFVNRNKQFPSLLIEFGYLSSPNDEAIIQDDNHQWNMAKGVAQGVLNYYN